MNNLDFKFNKIILKLDFNKFFDSGEHWLTSADGSTFDLPRELN